MPDTPSNQPRWYALSVEDASGRLEVDTARGISSDEAERRRKEYGANRLAATKKVPGWLRFLRQYREFMQILLVTAAVVNQVVVHQLSTTLVLLGLTVFNAVLSMHQESKAGASLAALEKMLKSTARVRRDGAVTEIESEDLVPGDIVLMESGDRVPADGRLFVAASLEIEEAALTGESVAASKSVEAIAGEDVPLGDRGCMAYMNTSVTRGRAEMIVTDTGMKTEMGHIADLLNKTKVVKTPVQKQLDRLTVTIACLAGITLVIMIVLGTRNDQPFDEIFLAGVALAVAAIPTGMPAVVTTLYSLGTRVLAGQNAIVKRLPSVETLGSVSAICSDKTGTLTLNKMTAREFTVPGQNRFKVTGEGYDTDGTLLHAGGAKVDLDDVMLPMALCADARLDDGALIGDPTEGALIVLAEKGGISVDNAREMYPRVAEVPFDSDYKFMATFHKMENAAGEPVIRCFVKGAPDVLIARGSSYWVPGAEVVPVTDENRNLALQENERMAKEGERVMVVARRDFDPDSFDAKSDLIGQVDGLTLLAMVGIVDPPRPEAKAAIAECHNAGIQVRMITGDHAVTAAAIGHELGIEGEALTGAQFAALSDSELAQRLPEIGVVARVAPEDKIRMVDILQREGNIVAMTGDGVNDAPALKKADIGVAMGITGTEVSKGAAVMVLTDDNFATIVKAVEYGRAIYDNLSKYVRFQMTALVAFIVSYLGAALLTIAGGVPFSPLTVLYINFLVQVPQAISLGFAKPSEGLMDRNPRPLGQPLLSAWQWVRIAFVGVLMAAGTLYLEDYFHVKDPAVGVTMGFAVFSLFIVAMGLTSRSEKASVLSAESFADLRQMKLLGLSLLLTLVATELGFLQRILGLTHLTVWRWLVCVLFAAGLVFVDELIKVFLRWRGRRSGTA